MMSLALQRFSSASKPSSSRKRPDSVLVSPNYTSEESVPPHPSSSPSSPASLAPSTTDAGVSLQDAQTKQKRRKLHHQDHVQKFQRRKRGDEIKKASSVTDAAIRKEGQGRATMKPRMKKICASSQPSSIGSITTLLPDRNDTVVGDSKKSEKNKVLLVSTATSIDDKDTKKMNQNFRKGKESKAVRPFRIRVGCIVALRYRPTETQNVVQFISSSLLSPIKKMKEIPTNMDENGRSNDHEQKNESHLEQQMYSIGHTKGRHPKHRTISTINTMELWLTPQPGRDEGYALIGKRIRCMFRKNISSEGNDGEKHGNARLEGNIVAVQMKGDNSSSNDWIRAQVLVNEHKVIDSKPYLKRFRFDDDSTNVTELEKKRRESETDIRGVANVVLNIMLPSNSVANDDGSKTNRNKQESDRNHLMVSEWAIKKRVPVPNGLNNQATNQSVLRNKCYIGDRNDDAIRQKMNWRWVAEKYHPYYKDCVSFDRSLVDPILIGKVLETNIQKKTIILQKMYLPEHTRQGRLSHHSTNEIFDDASYKVISGNDEGRCGNNANLQSNTKYTLYEVPIKDALVIGFKPKRIRHDDKTPSSKRMITRYGYSAKNDIFHPILVESTNIDVNTNGDKINGDGSNGAASDLLATQACYRCRREEKVNKMKHCSFETCQEASLAEVLSGKASQIGKSWCAGCCQFLCERGLFTKVQDNSWCCPCCIGACDCEVCTSSRAAERRQTLFGETIKAHVHKVSAMTSLSEQSNVGTSEEKNDARAQQPCSTCLKQCAKSLTKCMVCSTVTHKECYIWGKKLFQFGTHVNGTTKNNQVNMENFSKEEIKKTQEKEKINMEQLTKKERKKLRKRERLQKKVLQKNALKRCYSCLSHDNYSQSQHPHLNSSSIGESSLTILNATAKLLEMLPPVDFELPYNFASVPEIKSDPHTEDCDIRSIVGMRDMPGVSPRTTSNKAIIDSTPVPSKSSKGLKNTKVSRSSQKAIIDSTPLPSKSSNTKVPRSSKKVTIDPISLLLIKSEGRKKTKQTLIDVRVEKQIEEEEINEWQSTCCRIVPYTKIKSRNKNNSAAHAACAVASTRSSGRRRPTVSSENRRRGRSNVVTGESISSRATRAKQRIIRKDIALLGKSSLGTTNQLSGCEQSLRFGKSMIHGWGVFTDTGINPGDLIVEYRGVLIGNAVADKREKEYEMAKIGSDYMFRIDKEIVCDATHHGNVARFINASCTPNCYTQIITISGAKRIAIYAKRKIVAGEELCYDYMFQPEFDHSKRIPCNCTASECKGFMNWDKRYVTIPDS